MLKHVIPVEGKAAVKDDGTPILGKVAVDVDAPFYRKRLNEGAIKLFKKTKPVKPEAKDG